MKKTKPRKRGTKRRSAGTSRRVADANLSFQNREDSPAAIPTCRIQDRHVTWTPPDPSSPVGLAFLADLHWDGGIQAMNFERDIQTILETPNLFVVLGGDIIDNQIKHLSGLLASRTRPGTQWKWLRRFLRRIRPKLVACISGNHDAWTALLTDLDLLEFETSDLGIPYDQDELTLKVQMTDAEYVVGLRHKYPGGSKANPALKVKNWWRDGDTDFDVGVVCHDHTAVIEPFVRHGRVRWAMRPGTYQTESRYAIREGYHCPIPATPVAVFQPFKKDVHGFLSLDWGGRYLRGVSG